MAIWTHTTRSSERGTKNQSPWFTLSKFWGDPSSSFLYEIFTFSASQKEVDKELPGRLEMDIFWNLVVNSFLDIVLLPHLDFPYKLCSRIGRILKIYQSLWWGPVTSRDVQSEFKTSSSSSLVGRHLINRRKKTGRLTNDNEKTAIWRYISY